jgi:FkbM family methyltransferase
MAFRNARNILKHCPPFSSYKLLLASAMNSRREYYATWFTLLRPFIRKGEVSFKYRCYGRSLKANLRMSELMSDVQSIWELCISDGYEIDLRFKPDLVVDCGGNMGLFTMRMFAAASSAGNAEVNFVIVEPLPQNIELIQRHLKMNGIAAVIKPACIGGARRSIPFYCREAIRSSFDPQMPFTQVVDMPVLSIQDVIGPSDAKRILVKIDIEGMELEALNAFVPFEHRAVYVQGELHDYEHEASLMEDLFRRHGWAFSFYWIYDNYAHFRACSPAALPLIPSMNDLNLPQ